MANYDYIIGIDPDIEKSGVALLDVRNRTFIRNESLTFPDVCELMQDINAFTEPNARVGVFVEGGWMVNKSNYHQAQGHRAERIAKNVGENHGTGKQLLAMAHHYGLDARAIHPLRKCWRGKDGKITHEELASFTHITKRTNQDARDAALIAWCMADLPIRIIITKK